MQTFSEQLNFWLKSTMLQILVQLSVIPDLSGHKNRISQYDEVYKTTSAKIKKYNAINERNSMVS